MKKDVSVECSVKCVGSQHSPLFSDGMSHCVLVVSSHSSESESEVAQSCSTLLSPWNFPGNSTGVGCHFHLQGIFPTQGLNSSLPYCRQTLYRLSHQGSCWETCFCELGNRGLMAKGVFFVCETCIITATSLLGNTLVHVSLHYNNRFGQVFNVSVSNGLLASSCWEVI